MSTDVPFDDERSTFQTGLRLLCPDCGSEVEIKVPTPVKHPNQVFRCCGKDMVPTNPPEA